MLEDFFSYNIRFTLEELFHALDVMEGARGKSAYDSRWHMLVMSSENREVTVRTLRLLAVFAVYRNVKKGFILVTSDGDIESLASRYATAPYKVVRCERNDIIALGRCLSVCTYSNVLSFNSLDLTTDNDANELVKAGKLTPDEILALACLQLDHVPDEQEIKDCELKICDRSETPATIDWRNYPPAKPENGMIDIYSQIFSGDIINKDLPIFIAGTIKASAVLRDRMDGYNVEGIIDNDRDKQGAQYEGLVVYSPEELPERFGYDIGIIVHTSHFREICEQLCSMGYEMGKQILPAYYEPDLYIDTDRLKNIIEETYSDGMEVYKKIRSTYPDRLLVHLPYSGTGDAYLAGMYMRQMTETHRLPEVVFIVRSGACGKIIDLFGYEHLTLDETASDSLIKYVRINGFGNSKYIMLNDSYDFRTSIRLRGINGVDFHTMFRTSVFKVPTMLSIPDIKQEQADDLIKEYEIEVGNTVLLSPFATTADSVNEEVWRRIVSGLKNMGYTVCTNIASDKEKPVEGTMGVFIPYDKLLDFVDKCGCFIGLRSGLCDIISSTKAKKIVIYPSFIGNEMHTPHFALIYFGLKNMGLCGEETEEIEFNRNEDERLVDGILSILRK